jgi:hypothetical protein
MFLTEVAEKDEKLFMSTNIFRDSYDLPDCYTDGV